MIYYQYKLIKSITCHKHLDNCKNKYIIITIDNLSLILHEVGVFPLIL